MVLIGIGRQTEINSFFFFNGAIFHYFLQASIQPYEFGRDKIRLTPPLYLFVPKQSQREIEAN